MSIANWIAKRKSPLKLTIALVAAISFFSACGKSGSIGGASLSSVSGLITVSALYPTSQGASWTPIQASDRYYIKGLSLTITGVCTRGIDKIKVHEGTSAEYPETAACLDDGTFTFQKIYTAVTDEGDKTLTLIAYDVSGGVVSGTTMTKDVRIDNTAPVQVVITDPSQTPLNYNGSDNPYVITGTCSADTVKIVGPAGVVITPTGTNWTYNGALVSGSTESFTFYAFDLAGNQAVGTTQDIAWAPNASILAGGAFSGGIASDVSGMSSEMSVNFISGRVQDSVPNYYLSTGFNYIINKARGL